MNVSRPGGGAKSIDTSTAIPTAAPRFLSTNSTRARAAVGPLVRAGLVVGVGVCAGEPVAMSNGCAEIRAFLARNDVIAQVAPSMEHQNNSSLFALAGWIKSYENEIGRPATQAELDCVFDQWCQPSRKFWRPELEHDDYDAEFRMAYSYRRHGFNENPLELAVARAKAAPLPEISGFKSQRARLIAAVCRELQKMMGENPFFVPTRQIGELIDVHWTTVANWLRLLEPRIIRLAPGEIRKRGVPRSPRYFYCDANEREQT